jgi:hypothetical protein
MKTGPILIALSALAGCSKSAADNIVQVQAKPSDTVVVGRWCFKPSAVQSTWEFIEISKNGSYSAVDQHGDGSTSNQLLTSKSDGLWVEGGNTGDHYVLPSTWGGDLVIADNEGEIGRATAMPQNASPTDCFGS